MLKTIKINIIIISTFNIFPLFIALIINNLLFKKAIPANIIGTVFSVVLEVIADTEDQEINLIFQQNKQIK